MRQRGAQSGFTLFELLVVLALTAVVTGIGTVTLFKMTDNWSALRMRTELDRRAESVFESMQDDIAAMVSSSLAPASVQGSSATAEHPQFYRIPLADDAVTLSVTGTTPEGYSAPVLVTYRVKRDSGEASGAGMMLVRSQNRPGAADEAASEQTVQEGVLQFQVEYTADGSTWQREWAETSPPRAIRASLTMADPVNPMREQIARSYVFPVHVQ